MNRRFDDLQEDIRELRTLVVEALRRTEPAGSGSGFRLRS